MGTATVDGHCIIVVIVQEKVVITNQQNKSQQPQQSASSSIAVWHAWARGCLQSSPQLAGLLQDKQYNVESWTSPDVLPAHFADAYSDDDDYHAAMGDDTENEDTDDEYYSIQESRRRRTSLCCCCCPSWGSGKPKGRAAATESTPFLPSQSLVLLVLVLDFLQKVFELVRVPKTTTTAATTTIRPLTVQEVLDRLPSVLSQPALQQLPFKGLAGKSAKPWKLHKSIPVNAKLAVATTTTLNAAAAVAFAQPLLQKSPPVAEMVRA